MRIAIYARVSKPPKGQLTEQAKRDQNPDVQLLPLQEWAAREKHKIVDVYIDLQSGKNAQRPRLQRMMREIEKGLRDIDAVVVWKLDRFGRSVRDLYNLVAKLQAAEVSFVSVSEGFDLRSSIG